MTVILNSNIQIMDTELKCHSKASEEYVHVQFNYSGDIWDGWVPVEYRRTGVSLKTQDDVYSYLNKVYEQMKPENFDNWKMNKISFGKTKTQKQLKAF